MKTKVFESANLQYILLDINGWFDSMWINEGDPAPIRIKSIEFSDDSQQATVTYFDI